MKKINFNTGDFNKLSLMKIDGLNSEAMIFEYGKFVIKYFKEYIDLCSKREILEQFISCRKDVVSDLPEIVMPEALFYLDEKFKGYVMEYVNGKTLKSILSDDGISFEKKRDCLVKIGEFLAKLDSVRDTNFRLRNLYLNDLHSNNIIVMPDGNLRIIEVDSMSLNGKGLFPAYYLEIPYGSRLFELKSKYNIQYDNFLLSEGLLFDSMVANRESDIYCYIMMIVEFLTGEVLFEKEYEDYKICMKKLLDKGLPKELFDIFMNIYSEEENENPFKLLYKLDSQMIL
ncbi:MAG: hypothetical protein IJ475_02985 [Bacilli bacterium]|nr:hypothetical protein [Bacilli bacterium]